MGSSGTDPASLDAVKVGPRPPQMITRRAVLWTSGAIASMAAIGSSPAAPASAAPAGVTIALWGTTLRAFDEPFTQKIDIGRLKGATITGSATVLSGAVVSATIDARVQRVSGEPASVRIGTGTQLIEVESTTAGNLTTVRLTLPQMSSDEAAIGFPFADNLLYPNENIGPAEAPTVNVAVEGQLEPVATSTLDVEGSPATGLAWAGEIEVVWLRELDVDGKYGSAYTSPSVVHLKSVGPGDIPAGAMVNIVVDGHIVEALSLASTRLKSEASAPKCTFTAAPAGSNGGGSISFDEPLAGGDSVIFELATVSATTPSVTDGITYARVSIVASPEALAMQRRTGRETAVAVSEGGTPLVPDGARGKN